jgi:hypothetical protein
MAPAALIDGPFVVPDTTAQPTLVADGMGGQLATYPSRPGVWYLTDAATLAANIAALSPYVSAARPLPRVWAGDNAQAPAVTVLLNFPNASSALTAMQLLGPVSN